MTFKDDLLLFLKKSPTAFHATAELKARLQGAGFKELKEKDVWGNLKPGKYFVTRNDSAVIAFALNGKKLAETGFKMMGSHTDSPALKLKFNPHYMAKDMGMLGTEVFGGPILDTWFDRELCLAGRVSFMNSEGQLEDALINVDDVVGIVPNVAIHLNRSINDNRAIDKQKELNVIFPAGNAKDFCFLSYLKKLVEQTGKKVTKVLSHDLFLYDAVPAKVWGNDLISSARLDNLLSSYMGISSLIDAQENANAMVVLNDHEECGSMSSTGASGTFLRDVLTRLAGGGEDFIRCMQSSFLISLDNAHAVHPNYSEKFDFNHQPVLGKGPVIKINGNQKYATNSRTAAYFMSLAHKQELPVQQFLSHSNMPCGTTIGPLTTSLLGVETIDVGFPSLSMHSIRETASLEDCRILKEILVRYF